MPHHSAHVSDTEEDTAIVRRCLREFAKDLQKAGEIPTDVSNSESNGEVEK
jgi:hypothetical protein